MITRLDIISTISKTAMIGTGIVFGANIACLAIAYILTKEQTPAGGYSLISIILAIIGIIDLIFGFVLKARMLKPLFDKANPPNAEILWQASLRTTIIISSICAALPVYGLASVIIEGNMNIMVGFAIVSLASFMLLRLRPRDFKRLTLADSRFDS